MRDFELEGEWDRIDRLEQADRLRKEEKENGPFVQAMDARLMEVERERTRRHNQLLIEDGRK
jgi:hypothetical protein